MPKNEVRLSGPSHLRLFRVAFWLRYSTALCMGVVVLGCACVAAKRQAFCDFLKSTGPSEWGDFR